MKIKHRTQKTAQPARSNIAGLGQLLKFIPRSMCMSVAKETGVNEMARTFSVWSHLGAMMFAQLAHALSLNDVCDWLKLKSRAIASFGMTPPTRNNLSHSNKFRDAEFVKSLFWKMLAHLQHSEPKFGTASKGRKILHRFRASIHAVDSTVLELVANCMTWAKHRRRKAAAKMHLRLNLRSFLPSYAVVDVGKEHDSKRAREVCSGLEDGEICIFDRAYVDFLHLWDLMQRGVFWVTRAKVNMNYRAKKNLPVPKGSDIIKDQLIVLTGAKSPKGMEVRRVEAWVEIEGVRRKMVFITNNRAWSPRSVCDLYRARWEIEVFFKQIKQTLKLSDFLGYSLNAVRWQVWVALLVYVLLRFAAHLSQWSHSFSRLFAVVRSALWERLDLLSLLNRYGTASGDLKLLGALQQAWLPGLAKVR